MSGVDQALHKLEQAKRPRGNQWIYTDEIADEICRRLEDGESLNGICKTPGFPSESTVRRWYVDDHCGFAAKYARARDIALDRMADELIEIADDSSGDVKPDDGEGGPPVMDGEFVQRSKLRVDTRKWVMSKLAPKKYGDRVQHEHSGTITLASVLAAVDAPVVEAKAEPAE